MLDLNSQDVGTEVFRKKSISRGLLKFCCLSSLGRQMKKLVAMLIFSLLFTLCLSAQNSGTGEYKLKNALVGFGLGSRQQGDMDSAKLLLSADITGLSLMVIGGTGLCLSSFLYDYMHAYYGEISTADLWISGSVLGAGILVFVSGRILGLILPDKFVINENADVSVDVLGGNLSMSVQLKF